MLTAFSLIPFFVAPLTLVSLIVLFRLTHSRPLRAGYLLGMISYLGWLGLLYALPLDHFDTIWLYGLPLTWFILLFRFGFPQSAYRDMPPHLEEPGLTQETQLGAAGTHEALTFYFLLLFVGLILLQLILHLANRYA